MRRAAGGEPGRTDCRASALQRRVSTAGDNPRLTSCAVFDIKKYHQPGCKCQDRSRRVDRLHDHGHTRVEDRPAELAGRGYVAILIGLVLVRDGLTVSGAFSNGDGHSSV
jgi:hypothetical protein